MRDVREPFVSALDKGDRATDVAQRPERKREVQQGADAGVLPETKGKIVVAPGHEQGQRPLEMLSRLVKLPGKPMSNSRRPMGDACLRRIGPRLDITQERRGVRSHR